MPFALFLHFRTCSTSSFYKNQGSMELVAFLASPPLYQFNDEGTVIKDGLTFQLMKIVAQQFGVQDMSIAPSLRTDFGDVGNMSSDNDLAFMHLGMASTRCKSEGGFLYSDDQVASSSQTPSDFNETHYFYFSGHCHEST